MDLDKSVYMNHYIGQKERVKDVYRGNLEKKLEKYRKEFAEFERHHPGKRNEVLKKIDKFNGKISMSSGRQLKREEIEQVDDHYQMANLSIENHRNSYHEFPPAHTENNFSSKAAKIRAIQPTSSRSARELNDERDNEIESDYFTLESLQMVKSVEDLYYKNNVQNIY